ncbi:MAG: type II toxin-antitoxin system RelE/ParE family toxin [Candidatus Dormiibacterota bacterium]
MNEFIDSLDAETQEELDHTILLLNRLEPSDPPLTFPFSSQVEGQLRELRCHYGRRLYRILYQRSGNLFVLVHALVKSSKTLPRRDVQVAQERWADFKTRMDAQPRMPPRAAGHDAP